MQAPSGPGERCVQHFENPLLIEDGIPQPDAERLASSELGASRIDAPSADAPGIPWRRLSKPWARVPSNASEQDARMRREE